MFNKAENSGYRNMMAGIEMKTLVYGQTTLMAEYRLEKGSLLPDHNHPHEQTGYLVSGKLRLTIGDDTRIMEAGDSWNVAGNVVHGAEVLEDTIAVEVFSPVREDFLPKDA